MSYTELKIIMEDGDLLGIRYDEAYPDQGEYDNDDDEHYEARTDAYYASERGYNIDQDKDRWFAELQAL